MTWRQLLQSQSCQIKILFHGLLTIHVHNYNISILWHHNFCCHFSACCTFSNNDIPCHECRQSCGNTSPSWASTGHSGGPTDVLPCQEAPVELPCKTWGRQICCISRRHARGVDSGQVFGQLAWGQWLDHGSHKWWYSFWRNSRFFLQNVSSWKDKAYLSVHCSCVVHLGGQCICALWRQGTGWWSCGLHNMEETRQNSTQSVGNMPPLPPRHLLPHVLQIIPRNPKYTGFSQRGIIMENPQSTTKMPGNPFH